MLSSTFLFRSFPSMSVSEDQLPLGLSLASGECPGIIKCGHLTQESYLVLSTVGLNGPEQLLYYLEFDYCYVQCCCSKN